MIGANVGMDWAVAQRRHRHVFASPPCRIMHKFQSRSTTPSGQLRPVHEPPTSRLGLLHRRGCFRAGRRRRASRWCAARCGSWTETSVVLEVHTAPRCRCPAGRWHESSTACRMPAWSTHRPAKWFTGPKPAPGWTDRAGRLW